MLLYGKDLLKKTLPSLPGNASSFSSFFQSARVRNELRVFPKLVVEIVERGMVVCDRAEYELTSRPRASPILCRNPAKFSKFAIEHST